MGDQTGAVVEVDLIAQPDVLDVITGKLGITTHSAAPSAAQPYPLVLQAGALVDRANIQARCPLLALLVGDLAPLANTL